MASAGKSRALFGWGSGKSYNSNSNRTRRRILVVGGTGHLGRHVVAASARLGHPTVALVRDTAPSDPSKAALLRSFQDAGVTLVEGDLDDQASLVSAAKGADVVISTVGSPQIADQTKLIDAIKEAGNVKRFFPSEFGLDVERTGIVEPGKSVVAGKAAIRRATEAAGVPYTYTSAGYFAGFALPSIGQFFLLGGPPGPPTDDKAAVVVVGDGDVKAVFVDEGDIAAYAVLAAADPRAENRTLYIKPPANAVSHNELLSLWEEKTGRTLRREYVPEEAVLKQIQEAPFRQNVVLAIAHASYVLGEQTGFEIDPAKGVDATELYPDVKYTTVDEYLDRLLSDSSSI